MNKRGLEFIARILVGILAGAVIFYATIEYILPVAAPFLIAWFVAFVVREPAAKISGKTRISPKVIRPILAILLTLMAFGAISLFVWKCTSMLWELLSDIGEGKNPIYDVIIALSDPRLPVFGDGISEELAERISEAISSMITSLFTSLASSLTDWISSVPSILLFLLVTVIALVYFAIDLEKINTRVRSLLPKSLSARLSGIRESFLSTAGKYIGAYMLLMLETFGVLLIGFIILGVERASTLALIVSVLDLLPIIGVGTVLVPWSVISFVTGERFLGVGLLLLFVLNTVIRELTEPKIVGKSLDMHPLMTLIFIYVGYALFGLSGLVALPVLAMLSGAILNNRHTPEVDKPSGKK